MSTSCVIDNHHHHHHRSESDNPSDSENLQPLVPARAFPLGESGPDPSLGAPFTPSRRRASPKVLTGELLSALSRVLGRPMTYFLVGSPVRDRVRLAARGDDGGDVASRVERILELLEIDDDLDDLQLTGERPAPGEPPWRIFAEHAQSDTRRRPRRREQN